MTNILLSFIALISIPVGAIILNAIAGKLLFRKPWPAARCFVQECLISAVITAAVTLAICLVLVWTGFTESQFFRPSRRDYAEHTKLGITPKDVFFESKDGTRLHGWFVPSKSQPIGTVIHFHGSDRNITDTIKEKKNITIQRLIKKMLKCEDLPHID